MNLSLNNNLKLAIQKDGRLTGDTVKLLNSAGLEFDGYKQKLFTTCRNLPVEILFLRDDDIPWCVESGAADLGIVGKNIVNETGVRINELLNLGFGFCSLCIAVPKESKIKTLEDLRGLRIATSFPKSVENYFREKKIPVSVVKVNGSVEISPALGMAEAIADIVSTGNSLAVNDLRKLEKIYDTQAVLVANRSLGESSWKNELVDKLLIRIKGVLYETRRLG